MNINSVFKPLYQNQNKLKTETANSHENIQKKIHKQKHEFDSNGRK